MGNDESYAEMRERVEREAYFKNKTETELTRLHQIEMWAREAVQYIDWKNHVSITSKWELLTQAKSLGLLEDK